MSTDAAAGFWSYSHEDNSMDGGAILELARLVKDEYNLLSEEPLELFVDHESIVWGEEWRERINSALSQTTFFIPIITPRYFRRPECRRELLEFAAKAKSLGIEDLLLPIIYVEVQNFSDENPDEAIAVVARTQYVDWRAARLIETSSRSYRAEVNSLACRLLEIARAVAERQLNVESSIDLADAGVDGIAEIVERLIKLLPEWLDAVQGDSILLVQAHATWHEIWPKIQKLRKSGAPASAILSTQIRAAKEMLPLLERAEGEMRIYAARSVELDPLVSELARLVTEHPESYSLAMPIRESIDEIMSRIRHNEEEMSAPGAHSISVHFDEMRHLGRMFQKCSALFRSADGAQAEGDDIVRRWDAELTRPV